jgi:hypothetical protein
MKYSLLLLFCSKLPQIKMRIRYIKKYDDHIPQAVACECKTFLERKYVRGFFYYQITEHRRGFAILFWYPCGFCQYQMVSFMSNAEGRQASKAGTFAEVQRSHVSVPHLPPTPHPCPYFIHVFFFMKLYVAKSICCIRRVCCYERLSCKMVRRHATLLRGLGCRLNRKN